MIVETYRPGDFSAFLRTAQRRLRAHLAAPPDIYPWPCEHCSRCDFIPVCRERWEDDDHLTRVASIRRDQIEKLERRRRHDARRPRGVAGRPPRAPRSRRRCSSALRDQAGAPAPPPPHRRAHPPPARAGERARPRPPAAALARRPLLRHGGRPVLRGRRRARVPVRRALARARRRRSTTRAILGPRPRPASGRRSSSSSTSSTSAVAEHPDMHVYHYAAYEPSTLARLMGAHATREDEVDELLRGEVLVDLLRSSARACAPASSSYSLKEIEQFFFTRKADVSSGNDAVLEFERWLDDRRRGAPRRHRGLQRGGLPRDARAARLAARAARPRPRPSSGSRSRSGCRPSSARRRRSRPRSSRRRPASATPSSTAADGRDERWLRRSSSTTTAARRARAGGGTSAGSR